jgi:purine-nucleoside phosphorylase
METETKTMQEKIQEAIDFLDSKMVTPPLIGMILGTGLGRITEKIEVSVRVPYEEIPHFPVSTIEGHQGTLVCGTLANKPVMAMEGRFHLYEGYSPQEITFPIRVMSKLGVQYLFISSAAGGLDLRFTRGDLMVVHDHINLTGTNPLVGPNWDAFGPRFPDMSEVYDGDLIRLAKEKGKDIGGHCGLKILLIVAITNVNIPDAMEKTSLEQVIAAAEEAGPRLALLWEEIIRALP